MSKTDQYYIQEVLKGNDNEFEYLVNKYKDLIFTLCLRITKDHYIAEEASQDTFMKAYKSLAKFNGESKFSSWLYRIAYNTSLDKIKTQKRRITTETLEEYHEDFNSDLRNSFDILEQQELKTLMQASLKKLNEDEAFILTLYYYEDLSMREISEIISATENSVKVKIFRSRKKLLSIVKRHIPQEILSSYE